MSATTRATDPPPVRRSVPCSCGASSCEAPRHGSPKRSMGVVRVGRRSRKARVVVRRELRQKRVAYLDRADGAQAQLLHEAVLERLVCSLDATLGLRGVGAQDVDTELRHGARELRAAVAGVRLLRRHAEDAVLVAVERDGPCASTSFSHASVGPKSPYFSRTSRTARRADRQRAGEDSADRASSTRVQRRLPPCTTDTAARSRGLLTARGPLDLLLSGGSHRGTVRRRRAAGS